MWSKHGLILYQSYVGIGSVRTVNNMSILNSNLRKSRLRLNSVSEAMNIIADEVRNNVGAPTSNADKVEVQ